MLKAIFLKEWWKTRLCVCLAFVFILCMTVYILLRLRNSLQVSGAVLTIADMLSRDHLYIEPLKIIFVLIGAVLACVQWLPEMLQKRIKLTLHLPVSYPRSIGYMLLYGATILLSLSLINSLLIGTTEMVWLPWELVHYALGTLLPYYVAGLLVYLLGSWVILEPTWSGRCCALVMSIGLTALFFLGTGLPLTYSKFLPILLVLTALCGLLPLYSVYRFTLGKGL